MSPLLHLCRRSGISRWCLGSSLHECVRRFSKVICDITHILFSIDFFQAKRHSDERFLQLASQRAFEPTHMIPRVSKTRILTSILIIDTPLPDDEYLLPLIRSQFHYISRSQSLPMPVFAQTLTISYLFSFAARTRPCHRLICTCVYPP